MVDIQDMTLMFMEIYIYWSLVSFEHSYDSVQEGNLQKVSLGQESMERENSMGRVFGLWDKSILYEKNEKYIWISKFLIFLDF